MHGRLGDSLRNSVNRFWSGNTDRFLPDRLDQFLDSELNPELGFRYTVNRSFQLKLNGVTRSVLSRHE